MNAREISTVLLLTLLSFQLYQSSLADEVASRQASEACAKLALRIKKHWFGPRHGEYNPVKVRIVLDADGSILKWKILKKGYVSIWNANAISAVKTTDFKPFLLSVLSERNAENLIQNQLSMLAPTESDHSSEEHSRDASGRPLTGVEVSFNSPSPQEHRNIVEVTLFDLAADNDPSGWAPVPQL